MEASDTKKLLALLAALAFALLGITKCDVFPRGVNQALSPPITTNLLLLVGVLAAYAAIVQYLADAHVSRARAAGSEREKELREQIRNSDDYRDRKLHENQQEIEMLRGMVRGDNRLPLIDIVTGIPNQLQWENDFENLSKIEDPDLRYQIIMIDLYNSHEIYKVYGYVKGDQVIKEFARTIFNSMRRDECIYKIKNRGYLKTETTSEQKIWTNSGEHIRGHEFILIIKGDQLEALGFLNRLSRDLMPKINERTSKFILNSEIKLSFHAGMCELMVGDQPQDVLRKLEATPRKAINSPT
jgi:GGDEF domain-containing protein